MERHTEENHKNLSLGIDVGSTTVKTVVVSLDGEVLWKRYDRHHTKQAETLLEQLEAIRESYPGAELDLYITGSGAGSIGPVVGASFIQEVNAVQYAVEELHPDTGSVVDLGGQDAKIIVWKETAEGEKRAVVTMNDKCAGGTGATIDKILRKVGISPDKAREIPLDPTRLHKIAAKCGVFAETDVVGLIKMGVPEEEIISSLFHAIVKQNLQVLTRGNVLRDTVLLLGGPNRFFSALRDCWRQEIPKTWSERNHRPKEGPIEQVVFCPDDAEYFAALGSVLYGLEEKRAVKTAGQAAPETARTCPIEALEAYIAEGRKQRLSTSSKSRPGLVGSPEELEAFLSEYRPQKLEPRRLEPGQRIEAYLGIDGGSTSTKAVLVDPEGEVLAAAYVLSDGNPLRDVKRVLSELDDWAASQGATLEILGAGATGYAAALLKETLHLDVAIVETIAHMLSAIRYHGDVDIICDVGGQDIKVMFLKDGAVKDFRFNTQCSAGNGYFLQGMASQFDIPLEEYAERAFQAEIAPVFNYGCAVFMEQDKVNLQQLGWSAEEMLAGLALVLPLNIWKYVARVPNLAAYGRRVVLQGGTQRNLAALKAQVDDLREQIPDAEVMVHRYAGEAGAIGAALEAISQTKGASTFVGMENATRLEYESRNDESTRCPFCSNHCARTFVDVRTPAGPAATYITGYQCEKGSAATKEEMRAARRSRVTRCREVPDLVAEAARSVFEDHDSPEPPSEPGERGRGWWRALLPKPSEAERADAAARRASMRVGIPRALTLYHSAPYFRTYLEAAGVGEVVWSDVTSQELWDEGGQWGTVDPCFPSKVANAHVHDLLFEKKVDAILFPMIARLPSDLTGTMGSSACTLQTATPEVVEASFTKEQDYFALNGTVYWKPLVNLDRPRECARQMYQYLGRRLGLTWEESLRASERGFRALRRYRQRLRDKGREVIERAVRTDDIVVVCLGRPYHNDPGLNHGVPQEFQRRGFPVIGVESLPMDDDFLEPLFGPETRRTGEDHSRGVLDVWKRAYNAGGNHKLWAAKVVARHPNLVAIDFSSFKCGYDYSISSYLEKISEAPGSPYFVFHDLDQNKSTSALALRVESICHYLNQVKSSLRQAGELSSSSEAACPNTDAAKAA